MKVENAELIAKRIRILAEEGHDHLKAAATAGAGVIQSDMQRRAPRRAAGQSTYKGRSLGHMADNIVSEVTREKGGRLEISVGPHKQNYYVGWVEHGHKLRRVVSRYQKKPGGRRFRIMKELGEVKPHPFVRPAFDESQEEAQRVINAELKRRLGL